MSALPSNLTVPSAPCPPAAQNTRLATGSFASSLEFRTRVAFPRHELAAQKDDSRRARPSSETNGTPPLVPAGTVESCANSTGGVYDILFRRLLLARTAPRSQQSPRRSPGLTLALSPSHFHPQSAGGTPRTNPDWTEERSAYRKEPVPWRTRNKGNWYDCAASNGWQSVPPTGRLRVVETFSYLFTTSACTVRPTALRTSPIERCNLGLFPNFTREAPPLSHTTGERTGQAQPRPQSLLSPLSHQRWTLPASLPPSLPLPACLSLFIPQACARAVHSSDTRPRARSTA